MPCEHVPYITDIWVLKRDKLNHNLPMSVKAIACSRCGLILNDSNRNFSSIKFLILSIKQRHPNDDSSKIIERIMRWKARKDNERRYNEIWEEGGDIVSRLLVEAGVQADKSLGGVKRG